MNRILFTGGQVFDGTGTPPVPADLVPPAQSIRLARALSAAGTTVELELVPGATHFWDGASDVGGIIGRSVQFLRGLS